jgi:hypothetical protein
MTLTHEDARVLSARFAVDDHECREGGKTRNGDKKMWLFYIEEGAIIERLNDVDPAWSMTVDRTVRSEQYVSCHMTLTVKGVSRSGVGTAGAYYDKQAKVYAFDENVEKSAATDALKRCARLFGVGLYLKKSPRVYLDAGLQTWEAQKQAMAKLSAWLGGGVSPAPKSVQYGMWLNEVAVRRWLEARRDQYQPDVNLSDFANACLPILGIERFADLADRMSPADASDKLAAAFEQPEPVV